VLLLVKQSLVWREFDSVAGHFQSRLVSAFIDTVSDSGIEKTSSPAKIEDLAREGRRRR
jgi:hypothetical protein